MDPSRVIGTARRGSAQREADSRAPRAARQTNPAWSTVAQRAPESLEQQAPPESPLLSIHFNERMPWLVSADVATSDELLSTSLYGAPQTLPVISLPQIAGVTLPAIRQYVIDPPRLRSPYREQYQTYVNVRQTLLDMELESDFRRLVQLLDFPTDYYGAIEPQVFEILQKWAHEPFRPLPPRDPRQIGRSSYLNQLLLKLSMKLKDIGVFTTSWTSYYDLMFNHFNDVDQLRQIRDQYSLSFTGEEALGEVTFGGVLWERVKSGEVRDNIIGYFKGMKDAGVGFFTGLYHMVRHPIDTLEGLAKLPQTLKTFWEHRGELWDQFVNAPEEEKGRIIGRIFGEIEVLLATSGGGKAAAGLPKIAGEMRLPVLVEGVAAPAMAMTRIGTRVVPVTVDLAKFGKGASTMAMVSQALDKTSRGADAADEMRGSESRRQSRSTERDLAKEEALAEDATKIPGEEVIQQVLPTARGAAVEVALLEKLGLNKLVNWFKTLDGIEGGTYKLVKEGEKFVHTYFKPKGFSVKSTYLTDSAKIEEYVSDAVGQLKSFTEAVRTEGGVTVRVKGLSARQLEFVFDAQAKFANEGELLKLMKRLTKNARVRGVELRWWVDKGGELYEGTKYYRDQAKMLEDL